VGFLELGIIRLLAPLLILRFPLPGLLVAQALDKYDWKWLPFESQADYDFYQYWDKSLDTYYLALAFVVTRRWPDPLARHVALATFSWRVVGVGLFFITGERWLFLLFPNVFEGVFLFYEVYLLLSRRGVLFVSWTRLAWVVPFIAFPRWTREYFLHVLEEGPSELITMIERNADWWIWQGVYWTLPVLAMLIVLRRAWRRPGPVLAGTQSTSRST
jgi:hypothetical protein